MAAAAAGLSSRWVIPNQLSPPGRTLTEASPAAISPETASGMYHSALGSDPFAARNARNPDSSPAKSAGVKPQQFIETVSSPENRRPGPTSDRAIASSSVIGISGRSICWEPTVAQ